MSKADFLVIGSGIAGLNFALRASKYGKVIVVTKKEIMESNTNYAQGGIAAVISKDDSFASHIRDTLKTGCGLCDKKAVNVLVKNAPKEISELIELGINFNLCNGKLCLSKEGGHSENRIVYATDKTGNAVEEILVKNARKNRNIEVYENHLAIKLILKDKKCIGCVVLDKKNNKTKNIFSKVTVLATGGICQIYQHTSNPEIATGDGIAIAYRAGACLKDMEFVQFHPTVLNKKINSKNFLISETVRGEGGILKNSKNIAFMEKYHKLKDLAPRDTVARAVTAELKKGHVYIDISHKGKDFIKKRFPSIYKNCLKHGIDITKEPIPITPAAHFLCGGIKTDTYGNTNIKALFALGETACTQVHGANRLASNSLLESLVFSSRAAEASKKYLKNKIAIENADLNNRIKINKNSEIKKLENLKTKLQKIMWDNVGIIRKEKKLEHALEKIKTMEKQEKKIESKGISEKIIELRNMILAAKIITKAALMRKESRGTHYIEDYPYENKKWERHIIIKKTES